MSAVIDRILKLVASNRIVAFTKSHCPHSSATKSALTAASVRFIAEDIDLWTAQDMKEAQEYFEQSTGARTVPRVFIDGKCIGGNSDFQKLYVASGKLSELQ